jgi:transcriptional regulator with XRE-family HTH domain
VRRYDPDRLVLDVGRRVAEIRREKGLTQQALATKLKATMQWVQQIEYGANLTLFSLARLANALDLPLESFLAAPQGAQAARRGRPLKHVGAMPTSDDLVAKPRQRRRDVPPPAPQSPGAKPASSARTRPPSKVRPT